MRSSLPPLTSEILNVKRALALKPLKYQQISKCSLEADRLGRKQQSTQQMMRLGLEKEGPVGDGVFSFPILESRTDMWFSCGSWRLQSSSGYLTVPVCFKFQRMPLDTLTRKHRVMCILFGLCWCRKLKSQPEACYAHSTMSYIHSQAHSDKS